MNAGLRRARSLLGGRRRIATELRYVSQHDPITGLFNRARFESELERATRSSAGGTLILIDLDHFKYVNDSFGHRAGDELLVEAARIFRSCMRASDTLARVGGDEFAVILPGADANEARAVASRLLQGLRREANVPSPFGNRRVTASIGAAPFDGRTTAEELLVEADIAMYDAKDAGRGRICFYDDGENPRHRMRSRLTWAERIRTAIDEDRFALHAQPIVALDGDAAPRHELLIRMLDTDGTPISPATFLYVAERFDLVQEIDCWVLRRAIELLAGEQQSGNDVRLNVNISAKSLHSPELSTVIANLLDAAGADGSGLCLEITETAAIDNVARARAFARELGQLGCEVALDDFGAGFASFSYLKHLAFDFLKIDGEFIVDLVASRTDQLVVQSIVDIARGLGKHTIAEYVEDEPTLHLLRSYGVDFAQGYLLAKPAPCVPGYLSAPGPVLAMAA
jgi:diguanylate cyclase (GGDEF)-like protein